MNQHIHCIVNDCNYWAQGNRCEASEIIVTTDNFSTSQPDQVDAAMATKLTPQSAGTSMETCCKTFVTKGSNKVTADKITRMS